MEGNQLSKIFQTPVVWIVKSLDFVHFRTFKEEFFKYEVNQLQRKQIKVVLRTH